MQDEKPSWRIRTERNDQRKGYEACLLLKRITGQDVVQGK